MLNSSAALLDDVVEGDVLPVVQPLELVAHVFKQQPLLVRVALQPPLQQTQDELHLRTHHRFFIMQPIRPVVGNFSGFRMRRCRRKLRRIETISFVNRE